MSDPIECAKVGREDPRQREQKFLSVLNMFLFLSNYNLGATLSLTPQPMGGLINGNTWG